jgi:hypothetical protein
MNLAHWTKRHPLVAFFVLAFAMPWTVLVPLAILGEGAASFAIIFVSVRIAVLIAAWLAVVMLIALFGPARLTSRETWMQQKSVRHAQGQ